MSDLPKEPAASIFVSYRIADTLQTADRLAAELRREFGPEASVEFDFLAVNEPSYQGAVASFVYCDINRHVSQPALDLLAFALRYEITFQPVAHLQVIPTLANAATKYAVVSERSQSTQSLRPGT